MSTIKGSKKNLPYIIVFVICILVAAGSFVFLNKQYNQPVIMKDIIVISQDLGMYETIDDNKIMTRSVPETTNTEGYFTKRSDAVGKLTAFELKEGRPLLKEAVIDKKEIEDMAFVTINSNYAQTGDSKPGDIVDVYRVSLEDKEEWTGGNESEKVATDVIVISLANKDGKKPGEGSSIPLGGGTSKIEVVKLGVQDKYVQNIVPGSVNQENGYVLVVKKPFEKKISNINTEEILMEEDKNVKEDNEKNEDVKEEGEEIGAEETTEKGE
ncbi:CpaB family protein [Wukongibacter baidiensis]